ncbi:phage tail protein [Lacrimispora defluvii]|uniref:Tail fiber protein n=1 Tax=Lacrimispora defluvii TaxID=2719233 RepID=A0ABX1VZN6_9FIRM|nr:tail fiber protein [Lacrimispora defluvii]NNJ33337.1 tail fiber protein [Lacrimispora defluvii]
MDPYIGQIQLFPYNFEPRGWVLCDGRTMKIMQNQALYSLIGIIFGGNGTTEFKIPDLRNANPLATTNQMKYYIAIEGLYPMRS